MGVSLVTIAVTTDGSGDFSRDIVAAGRLMQYRYVPGAAPIDTNADIDLVGKTTGFVYVNQDNIGTSAFQKSPRHATHDATGTASLYAGSGEPVEDVMIAGPELLTFTVANGASAKSGTFYFWFEDAK